MNRSNGSAALLLVLLLVLSACGADSASEPTATYDGSGCTYDGPDEFDVGSEVTFTLVEMVEDSGVGFGVWRLPTGMTAEEIRDRGILNRGAQIAETEAEITESGIRLTFMFDSAGLYALNCAARPEDGPAVDYANLFTVTE